MHATKCLANHALILDLPLSFGQEFGHILSYGMELKRLITVMMDAPPT